MRHNMFLAGMALALLAPADDSGATPTSTARQITISGETVEIPAPYVAGHTLDEAEAYVLNQTYLENVRNNTAAKIKAAKEAAEKAGTPFSMDTPIGGEGPDATKTLRQVIQEYASTYKFGVRVARASEPVDPVEREARAIAREALNANLRKQNVKRKDISDEAFEEALALYAKNEKIVAEAKRRVKAREQIGAEELNLGNLAGSPQAEAEAPQSEG